MSEPLGAEKDRERAPINRTDELIGLLSSRVVGQAHALEHIVPSIQLHRSGLAPEGRPVGVFLLLGPTGTGKTRTVEALAEVLHGDARRIVKIDCGEFQSEHEVAKLIGAPPGYVGHAQTEPRLNQLVLDDTTSAGCDLSLVLFDEIEKAAPSLSQLLLGVLDKASLRLGDGGEVNFERSLIFLTSNLGARDMVSELQPGLGFETPARRPGAELSAHLERVGLRAVRRHFSPNSSTGSTPSSPIVRWETSLWWQSSSNTWSSYSGMFRADSVADRSTSRWLQRLGSSCSKKGPAWSTERGS